MVVVALLIICALVFLGCFSVRVWIRSRRCPAFPPQPTDASGRKRLTLAFFHPYCNAGGGGERVLWTAIRGIQQRFPHVDCVIYTGDVDATSEEILQRAKNRFNISLPKPVKFVFLLQRNVVEAARYPRFTLLGQSLGSMYLAWEALMKFVPDVYLDTMGYAFTIPIFRFLGGCRVGCYVHYPTISTDMLDQVAARNAQHNNAEFISKSVIMTHVKLLYYRFFAWAYGKAGSCSDVVMVNSSWTHAHILQLWKAASRMSIVYPPCDTKSLLELPLWDDTRQKHHNIASVAQFRPEKDHPLQIKAFRKFLLMQPENKRHLYHLILVGGCRNDEDKARVDALKSLVDELGIENNVRFELNVSYAELKKLLNESTIGLHTMWNEHFGIGVVEIMAAGAVILAHDSGGPREDIVVHYEDQKTGFLANSVDTYASAMDEILKLPSSERMDIRLAARRSVERFSEAEFESGFMAASEKLFM